MNENTDITGTVENAAEEKTPWYSKAALAAGTVGDSIPYYLFYTYFLYYLTTVVGITPAAAGIISSVAIVWNAIACPIVGYLSDNSKNPRGRKRPYMKMGFIGEIVLLVLIFIPVPFDGAVRTVYYIIIAILLWTCYTCVLIPWQSLGGEVFRGYNDRNTFLMWVSILSLPLSALCNSGPMWIQAWLLPQGVSEEVCWVVTAIIGVASLIAGFTLEVIGYSSDAVVTESMQHGLLSLATIVPAVLVVISIVLLSRYKIDRKRFNALKEALEKRKSGEEYSTEGFADIL